MSIDIIYISNYIDENTAARRNIKEYSHAANIKILNFALSLKPWKKVIILSTGRGGRAENFNFHNPFILKISGIPVCYAAFCYFSWIGYLLSAVSLASWVLRLYCKYPKAVFIIYNRRPIYLLAIFLIFILRSRCYLDLEDGGSEFRTQGFVQRLLDYTLVKIFDRICASGAIIACEYLRRETRIEKTMPYYGVLLAKKNTELRNWGKGKLLVIFGGSLREESGTRIFMEAVSLLHTKHQEVANQYLFLITGLGSLAGTLDVFSKQFEKRYIIFKGNVSGPDFHNLMNVGHIGLNLRDRIFPMAHNTFPSKVMDITRYGQLLISTNTSDVLKIFNRKYVLILNDSNPTDSLVEQLVWVAKHRQIAEEMAKSNQMDMLDRFSLSKTASDIIKFVR